MRKTTQAYRTQADLLKAMAHPTRLRILEILAEQGECCVCHLTAILRQRQPYVSQHLMVLRGQGLVEDHRDGVMVYYRISDPIIGAVLAATRNMVTASAEDGEFLPVPQAPVAGCACPHCGEQTSEA
jgi:DNA-binding transcriptional ArsR family regulator